MCGTLLSLLAKVLRIVTFSVRKLLRTLSDTKPVEPQFRGLDIIYGSPLTPGPPGVVRYTQDCRLHYVEVGRRNFRGVAQSWKNLPFSTLAEQTLCEIEQMVRSK